MISPWSPPPGVPPVPVLSQAEIEEELHRVFGTEHRNCYVAFFGTGAPGRVQVMARDFQIVPTRSELELRSHFPEVIKRSDLAGKVFLVDWTDKLPLDIECRLARGRLLRIASDNRLAALFGARSLDPRLTGTALASALLADPDLATRLQKVPGQILQADDAYARFLNAASGLPLEEPTRLEFLKLLLEDQRGPALAARMRGTQGAALEGEVLQFVTRRHGLLAAAAFQGWLAEQGGRFFQLALLLHAVRPGWGSGDSFSEGLLSQRLSAPDVPFGAALARAAGDLDDVLVRELVKQVAPREDSPLLRGAERLIEDPRFAGVLRQSLALPAGLEARRAALATALLALAEEPSPDALRAALVARDRLEQHFLEDPEAETALGCLRLAAWLVEDARPSPTPPLSSSAQRAIDLATWYARDGGFVDRLRRDLRGAREGAYAAAAARLLQRADDRRLRMDREFAEGLLAWVDQGQPSSRVIPIADASRRLAADFLHGDPARRLLVVLMDGMSHADSTQLLESMEEHDRWFPIGWRLEGAEGPTGLLPPVISALPSRTNVSRAAFFAGRQSRADWDKGTGEDRTRWAKNPHFRAFFEAGRAPVVLLKDDLFQGGGLSDTAIKLIDSDDFVVAVVVNAIDDLLKAGQQVRVRYSVPQIPTLRSLLAHAAANERAVLLIADHGHVPGDLLVSRGPGTSAGGARWRPLRDGEMPASFEVAFGGSQVWVPRGFSKVAAICDDRSVYGHATTYGEHGGATLAECICPAFLVAPESLLESRAATSRDEGLRTVARYEPAFWHSPEDLLTSAPMTAEVAAPRPPPTELPRPQGELFRSAELGAAPLPQGSAASAQLSRNALVTGLERSPVFKTHVEGRDKTRLRHGLEHLSLIADAGDQLSVEEFARRAAVSPFRASGPILELQTLLNLEGYPVLEYDRAGKQVRLNRAMLVQVFELPAGEP